MNTPYLLIALLVPWPLCAAMALVLWRVRGRFDAADDRCAAAQDAEAHVTRALQLFAHELQTLALGLRGNVDQLAQEQHQTATSLAVVTSQLEQLGNELAQHLAASTKSHHLAIENVAVGLLVGEAIGAMQAAIAPGRRHFRVAENANAGITLTVDRRAFRLIFARVLGEAVRSSRQDDWIDIGWNMSPSGFALHVSDEGIGSALPGLAEVEHDSRGIGLRLSLARSLVRAHGGSLEVEANMGVGTRVMIYLPVTPPDEVSQPALGATPSTAHILTTQAGQGTA